MITLEDARVQTKQFNDDDKVQQCLDNAKGVAEDFLDRPIPWLDDDGIEVPIPAGVRAGVLLITTWLYDNRIPGNGLLAPGSAEYLLLYPHRRLGI